jgi:uncharacterized protein (TIGR02266 family)
MTDRSTREHERAPLAVEVTLESDHNFYSGITANISDGGVFVATQAPPPTGTVVTIELALEGAAQTFTIRGEVCWTRAEWLSSEGVPAGCGIKWIEISREALDAIGRFVRHRDSIFYED